MKKTNLLLIVTALVLTAPFFAAAQNEPLLEKQSIFDLMHTGGVLKIELETDINTLISGKSTNDICPGYFHFTDKRGLEQKWPVDLKVRGKYRRRICDFPPLKLNFPKKELKAKGLKKHNNLKLITHCFDNLEGKELVMREYFIYKLYQLLFSEGYRAQLVKIKYVDTKNKKKFTHYGIILEDEKELAARLNCNICEDCYNIPSDHFQMKKVSINDLFQYMIGNTDWSVVAMRNILLMQPKDSSKLLVVPYDFDFSGLVNASYAVPNSNLNQKNIRERLFMGFAGTEEELKPTIDYFIMKKDAVLNYAKHFKLLSAGSRKDIFDYLESFYSTLEEGSVLR